MDIEGYVFIGIALVAFLTGMASGLAGSLFGLICTFGSVAVAVFLTPTVCNLEFVQTHIEDTPIVINGTEMFFLRTIVVFCALFVVSLFVLNLLKGLITGLIKRLKLLKIFDKLLGGAFNVAIIWAIYGILFAIANAGDEWLTVLDEQLIASGIDMSLTQIVGGLLEGTRNSGILTSVFGSFNPVGDLVVSALL